PGPLGRLAWRGGSTSAGQPHGRPPLNQERPSTVDNPRANVLLNLRVSDRLGDGRGPPRGGQVATVTVTPAASIAASTVGSALRSVTNSSTSEIEQMRARQTRPTLEPSATTITRSAWRIIDALVFASMSSCVVRPVRALMPSTPTIATSMLRPA